MKDPWQKAVDGYRWWRYWVTDEPHWGHPPGTWHVLYIGCGIHQTDAPEAAIAYAESHAEGELAREMMKHYGGIYKTQRLAQELGLTELRVPV